jgi:hypothetical protein
MQKINGSKQIKSSMQQPFSRNFQEKLLFASEVKNRTFEIWKK